MFKCIILSDPANDPRIMKVALCRPDDIHWCTECCPPGCPLLGDTGDGKIGCLGHNGKRTAERLTEPNTCLELDCLVGFLPRDREIIRKDISKLPPGEFKMTQVLSQHKIGTRVCAWCDRELGKVLDMEGKTHTICKECEEREGAVKKSNRHRLPHR